MDEDVKPRITFGQETEWVCLGCHPEILSPRPYRFGHVAAHFGKDECCADVYVDGEKHLRVLEAWAGQDGWIVEGLTSTENAIDPEQAQCGKVGGNHRFPVRRRRAAVEVRIH